MQGVPTDLLAVEDRWDLLELDVHFADCGSGQKGYEYELVPILVVLGHLTIGDTLKLVLLDVCLLVLIGCSLVGIDVAGTVEHHDLPTVRDLVGELDRELHRLLPRYAVLS